MKENEDKMGKFLKHEWDEEIKRIDEEVLSDSDLYDAAPVQMKEQVLQKIEDYEHEKAYEHLTEEDKEAIRLGRELLAQKNAGKAVASEPCEKAGDSNVVEIAGRRSGRKSGKRKKVYIVAASVAMLTLGLGMTSIGGKRYLIEAMNQVLGERELVQVDSREEDKKQSGVDSEEVAYQKFKDEFGFDPVKLMYRPKEMNFLEAEIDQTMQCAFFIYENEDKTKGLSYIVNTNYTDGAFGFDAEDSLISEYTQDISGVNIIIREYNDESIYSRYAAKFEYKNVHYILNGIMEKGEIENILKNLYFS